MFLQLAIACQLNIISVASVTSRVKDDRFKIFYGTNSPHTSGAHTAFYKLHTLYLILLSTMPDTLTHLYDDGLIKGLTLSNCNISCKFLRQFQGH